MAILREMLEPALGSPQPVVALPKRRRYKMTQAQFYEQPDEQQQQTPQQDDPRIIGGSAPLAIQQAQQRTQFRQPLSEEFITEQFQRIANRNPPPELEPVSRVQSANMELVQPSNFRSYYERLNAIREQNVHLEGAANARAAFQRMQSLAAAQSAGMAGGLGSVDGGGFGRAGSAALGKNYGRNAPHVQAAANELGSRFGIKNIGGFATSGHIKNSDHYTGHALDFMTTNGQGLADFTVSNANRLNVKYVIWNRQIWQPGRGWTRYTGRSPHTDHVHVSFYS